MWLVLIEIMCVSRTCRQREREGWARGRQGLERGCYKSSCQAQTLLTFSPLPISCLHLHIYFSSFLAGLSQLGHPLKSASALWGGLLSWRPGPLHRVEYTAGVSCGHGAGSGLKMCFMPQISVTPKMGPESVKNKAKQTN